MTMSERGTEPSFLTFAVVLPDGGSAGTQSADPAKGAPTGETVRTAAAGTEAVAPVSGLLLSTWADAWTYCKATAKYLGSHHWVPWLGGVTAVLTAITAAEIFTKLQEDTVSTAARIAVGAVVLLATAITALQAWTGARIKGLNDQFLAFHELHRKIQRDVEARAATPLPAGYADDVEKQLRGIIASMVPVSRRAWNDAKRDVLTEMGAELERLGMTSHGAPT
jgi:hypothetical protein